MNEANANEPGPPRPAPESAASEPSPGGARQALAPLLERVKNILLSPGAEWAKIDDEPATIGGIYRSYVMLLAAVPAVAGLLGTLVFGYSAFGITYRPPLVPTLMSAVVQYAITLGSVYLLALVIDLLAPKFGATPNRVQAFKVAAYSATAAWVAGIFGLLPALSMLSILGLYSLYLLYLGLPRLMRAPQDKALSYTVVVVLVMLVIGLLIGTVTAAITGTMVGRKATLPGSIAGIGGDKQQGRVSGEIRIPGVGSVDLGKLDQMARGAEAQVRAARGGGEGGGEQIRQMMQAEPVDAKTLGALLPERFAGLPLTERGSSSSGAGAVGSTRAQARYVDGDANIALNIVDMSLMRGVGAVAGVLNIEREQQTANGYERIGRVDGRMTTEKWDSRSRRGTYSILVGDRVLVEAEGRGIDDIEQLKKAVHGLDIAALEREIRAR